MFSSFLSFQTLVAALFVYLDKVYASEGSGNLSIVYVVVWGRSGADTSELATAKFREGVWKNALVHDKTRSEFQAWVIGEREGVV
jgi:hypothetical protein